MSQAGTAADIDLPWGTRVLPEAPTFDPTRLSAVAAAGQLGPHTDVLGELVISARKSLLLLRHAPASDAVLFAAGEYAEEAREPIRLAAQGLSIVTARGDREGAAWRLLDPARAAYNRRVHGTSAVKVTGPVAGETRLRTKADPTGRHFVGVRDLSPGGLTAWATLLVGQHLAGPARDDHRRGWVVEIDPLRPHSRPRARTMLGRLDPAHLRVDLADTRQVLVTMTRAADPATATPARRFRFVSRHRFDDSAGPLAASYNRGLLDQGTVWVLGADGGWVPLTTDRHSHVPGLSVADVLLDLDGAARLALAAPPTRADQAARPLAQAERVATMSAKSSNA